MKKKYYYYLIIGLLFFYNCEDAPIETQINSGGHELETFLSNEAVFKTIQLSNKIGSSSNLYVGDVDNKKSYAVVKLNSDVFSANENICLNESIDSISINLELFYDPLVDFNYSSPNIGDSLISNHQDNDDFVESENNQMHAFFTLQSNIEKIWNEDLSFNYNDQDYYFIYGNDSLHIDSLKTQSLPVTIGASKLIINLDLLDFDNNSTIDLLCSGNDESSIVVLLEYTGDNHLVIESANSPYFQPYLSIGYKQEVIEIQAYPKIEIDTLNNLLEIDSIYVQKNSDLDEFGTVLGFSSILDTNNIIDSFLLNSKVDLFDIEIIPNFHVNDTSNVIEFSLQDIHLVYRNYDPTGDDYDSLLNQDGTENNHLWDYGELFNDCGSDGLCNQEEPGYNIDGTEKNGIYDLGEPFYDYGIDSIPDSLESDDSSIDNYNPDPSQDNYDEFLNSNGSENNNICDEGEIFLDYGVDGIPDSLEGFDFAHDNFDPINNPNGTENNNQWDSGEWFYDTGLDGLWSIDELGYNLGTEGNNLYDIGEYYEDIGTDGIPDSLESNDSLDDNYNKDPHNDDWNDCGIDRCCDPYEDGEGGCLGYINLEYINGDDFNGDNYDLDLNSFGTEKNTIFDIGENWENNNLIDWYDVNNDTLYSISESDSGEIWFDWGIDQIKNISEPYYGSFPLSYSIGPNNYMINILNNIDTTFYQPDTSNDFDANLWISKIKKQDNGSFILTVSINSSKEIAAFQFKIDHARYYNSDTSWNDNSVDVSYVNSLRLIEDLSIYKQNNNEFNDSIYINYSESYVSVIDFANLNLFLEENQDAIISNALLTLYPDSLIDNDNDYFRLYLNRIVDEYNGEDYLDSLTNQYILDYPYYYSYLSAPDSIQFNIKRYIQKLVANEYQYNGLLLSTDGLGNNFDYFYFKQIIDQPIKIEILYSK